MSRYQILSFLKPVLGVILLSICVSPIVGTPGPTLRLATATSTANSGLLDYLLPEFEKDTSIKVHYLTVGTGKALNLGRHGDVDMILSHFRSAEEEFVKLNYGVERVEFMYNEFVVLGPSRDPAGIAESRSITEALRKIHDSKSLFVSRGDISGTHLKEMQLWQEIDYVPRGDWYKSVGQGMGKVIQITNELNAYTLADRGTWLAFKSRSSLVVLHKGTPPIINPYSVIAVNPKRLPFVNYLAAKTFINWLTSSKGQLLISRFKVQGKQLFFPTIQTSMSPQIGLLANDMNSY